MTDEIKTDASEALSGVKAEINKLEAVEVSATGWVKTHVAWVIGLCSFILGVVVGHVIK